jgi:hypothetical protein
MEGRRSCEKAEEEKQKAIRKSNAEILNDFIEIIFKAILWLIKFHWINKKAIFTGRTDCPPG